VSRGGRRRRR
jgi:hypothetical protein